MKFKAISQNSSDKIWWFSSFLSPKNDQNLISIDVSFLNLKDYKENDLNRVKENFIAPFNKTELS